MRSLTLTEAADALGLAPSTLRHQIRNGKLNARKVGRDWVVGPAALARYRAEHLGREGGRQDRPDPA